MRSQWSYQSAVGLSLLLAASLWLQALLGAQVTYEVLHAFVPFRNGAAPLAGLIQGTDGSFYGTTRGGGGKGVDMVGRLVIGEELTRLHSLASTAGGGAAAPL